jgi:transcriptional regulator with XRE-family HTH domain
MPELSSGWRLKMDKKQIGFRIKSLRTEKEWSQEELSRRLKVDRSTLSKIETGENVPSARILAELKRIFSISIDWLLTGMGFSQPGESGDKDINELLTAIRESPGVKHAILGFFYQYKANHPEFFRNPETQRLNESKKG